MDILQQCECPSKHYGHLHVTWNILLLPVTDISTFRFTVLEFMGIMKEKGSQEKGRRKFPENLKDLEDSEKRERKLRTLNSLQVLHFMKWWTVMKRKRDLFCTYIKSPGREKQNVVGSQVKSLIKSTPYFTVVCGRVGEEIGWKSSGDYHQFVSARCNCLSPLFFVGFSLFSLLTPSRMS